MRRILHNRAKCLVCGAVVESDGVHDFVTCPCGNLSVDGGQWYLRRSIRDGMDSYIDMSEYEEDEKCKR